MTTSSNNSSKSTPPENRLRIKSFDFGPIRHIPIDTGLGFPPAPKKGKNWGKIAGIGGGALLGLLALTHAMSRRDPREAARMNAAAVADPNEWRDMQHGYLDDAYVATRQGIASSSNGDNVYVTPIPPMSIESVELPALPEQQQPGLDGFSWTPTPWERANAQPSDLPAAPAQRDVRQMEGYIEQSNEARAQLRGMEKAPGVPALVDAIMSYKGMEDVDRPQRPVSVDPKDFAPKQYWPENNPRLGQTNLPVGFGPLIARILGWR